MKTKFLLLSIAALAPVVFSGCVGTGPNTQQGAVTGGTLGAITGAIIGHNSRGGDALGGAILGGTAGALAGGALGNSVDQQRGTLYPNSPYGYRERPMRRIQQPPPPLAETVPPPPAGDVLWIPGSWAYDGRGYAWTGGHWEIPPPDAHTYVAAHWETRPSGPAFVPASWR